MRRLPRYVIPKRLASGRVAFFYNVPTKHQALNSSYEEMLRRAGILNRLFDEWAKRRKGLPITVPVTPRYGDFAGPLVSKLHLA